MTNKDLKELKGITDPEVIRRFEAIKLSGKIGVEKASNEYRVSRPTLYNWIKKYKESGIIGLFDKPKANNGHPNKVSDEEKKIIISYVKKSSSLSYEEISVNLKKLNIHRHYKTIRRICIEAGIDKKNIKGKIRKEIRQDLIDSLLK